MWIKLNMANEMAERGDLLEIIDKEKNSSSVNY